VIRGEANYTSSIKFAPGCVSLNHTDPLCSITPQGLAATTVGPQWLFNGRMALTDISQGSFANEPLTWEVALWVRNLTDNKSLTQATFQNATGSFGAGWQPARTFGIDVKAKF
jgi:hypothetical protein